MDWGSWWWLGWRFVYCFVIIWLYWYWWFLCVDWIMCFCLVLLVLDVVGRFVLLLDWDLLVLFFGYWDGVGFCVGLVCCFCLVLVLIVFRVEWLGLDVLGFCDSGICYVKKIVDCYWCRVVDYFFSGWLLGVGRGCWWNRWFYCCICCVCFIVLVGLRW